MQNYTLPKSVSFVSVYSWKLIRKTILLQSLFRLFHNLFMKTDTQNYTFPAYVSFVCFSLYVKLNLQNDTLPSYSCLSLFCSFLSIRARWSAEQEASMQVCLQAACQPSLTYQCPPAMSEGSEGGSAWTTRLKI